MTRARIAWAIAIVDILAYIGSTVALPPDVSVVPFYVLYLVGIASFAGIGALLIVRFPKNPIGTLLLAAGTVLVAAIVIGTYADIGATQRPPWLGSTLARSLGDLLFFYPFVIAFIGVPLFFPDGRLLSPRFRWIVGLAVANVIAWTLGALFNTPLDAFVMFATLVSFGGAITSIWLRYRRGDPTQRQQIKWLAADVAVAIAALIPSLLLTSLYPALADAFSSVAVLAMLTLPVVIGVAILRYRLYEIDRIVSRTISYAVVTGGLLVVYLAVNLGLSSAFSSLTNGNSVAVAASTLIVAALFTPVRRRAQEIVDRRFNRARYDAERTIDTFSSRVRDEVDLSTLRHALVTTVADAVDPVEASVWLRSKPERP